MRMTLTVRDKFDAAHWLRDYDGKCSNIHGHTYQLEVYVVRSGDEARPDLVSGMVADFGVVKAILKETVIDPLDHSLIVDSESSLDHEVSASARVNGMKVFHMTQDRSTAEWLAMEIQSLLISPLLDAGLDLTKIRLWETEKCSVILERT